MTTQVDNALIHFPEWYDERGEWEAEAKGWLPGVRVELANGASYPFVFYDPVRLAQDIEAEGSDAVISELGLVVRASAYQIALFFRHNLKQSELNHVKNKT